MRFPLILEVEINDLPQLNKISVAAKSYWNYPQEWINSWIDELTIQAQDLQEQQFFKICDEKGIAGFGSLQENLDNFEINHFWINPEAIGKGYGKKLLLYLLDQVVKFGKPVLVVSDPNAEAFYRKFGFETIDHLESKPKGRYLPVMELNTY